MFCIDEVSIEVDPTKLNAGEDLETNQVKLLGVCKGLLNHITRSVEHCSSPLRKMFSETKQLVAKRFPEHHLRVVGGFYFLRFLCPALVCPEGFRLIPAPPAAKSRRSLILVSKILQNLANDVEFGEKEICPDMIPVNTFIKSNQTTMWTFLEQLSNPTHPRCTSAFVEMKQDPLASIHQCLQTNREKIGAILQKGGHGKIFENLCEALDAYTSGVIKSRRTSLPPPLDVSAFSTIRKRTSNSFPSPLVATPLSPTSSRVAELIPISSSPSSSLSSLLQLNLQQSTLLPIPELAAKLQKLEVVRETHDEKSEPQSEKSEFSKNTNYGRKLEQVQNSPRTNTREEQGEKSSPPPKLPNRDVSQSVRDLEVELNKEMQEIQALRLALESGGMEPKERVETHTRFVGLLQHLKVMLASYKELKQDRGDDEGRKLEDLNMDGL